MIPVPAGVRVWLAVGHTDMRRGKNGLALQVQQALQRAPHAGDLYVFRGKRSDLGKILWHDGLGMSLYAKRLERGRFIWPSPVQGAACGRAARIRRRGGHRQLKLMIAKMRHARFGASSERGRKLLDQLELQLEEMEAAATEDEAAVQANPPSQGAKPPPTRRKPVRAPFPPHIPRERVVPGPTSCPCCQGKLSKLGEDVTETLEVIPRQFKVIQTVRERFACRHRPMRTRPGA